MSSQNKLNKENMLFNFTRADFPVDLIDKDCIQHKAILFSEKETEPELYKTKTKYAKCYVVEESLEGKKKGGKFPKASANPHVKKPVQQQPQNSLGWRKNDQPEEGTGDFFDNFKGKTDQTQVNKFFKEKKFESLLQITKENNIHLGPESIEEKRETSERISKANQSSQNGSKVEVNYSKNDKGDDKSIDKFFEDFDTSKNKVFTINCIYKVNEFLSYPKEEPLWYFYHEAAKSSFGPLSSKKLEEMFNNKIIDQTVQVRFIDIFSHKLCKKPFTYFKLSDIDRPSFIGDIELSNLCNAAENIIKNAKRQLIAESKATQQSIEGDGDLFSDFSSGKAQEKKEKFSKKQKSRPVDVNLKVGFKTMTEQEENFEPFYKVAK